MGKCGFSMNSEYEEQESNMKSVFTKISSGTVFSDDSDSIIYMRTEEPSKNSLPGPI